MKISKLQAKLQIEVNVFKNVKKTTNILCKLCIPLWIGNTHIYNNSVENCLCMLQLIFIHFQNGNIWRVKCQVAIGMTCDLSSQMAELGNFRIWSMWYEGYDFWTSAYIHYFVHITTFFNSPYITLTCMSTFMEMFIKRLTETFHSILYRPSLVVCNQWLRWYIYKILVKYWGLISLNLVLTLYQSL